MLDCKLIIKQYLYVVNLTKNERFAFFHVVAIRHILGKGPRRV
jgi:hypothetical protein